MEDHRDMEDLNFKAGDPGAVRFGNFINYYFFHTTESRTDRLPLDLWNIPNQDRCLVLDVGCNCGDLTKALHLFLSKNTNFSSIHTLGIDIDPSLIHRANETNMIENALRFETVDIMSDDALTKLNGYLERLNAKKFDVIFCFSISMWIHINFGDDGLKKLLDTIKNLSNLIVIEPQTWSSYSSAARRIKRSASEIFPLFKTLKIRKNVEEMIEQYILQDETFTKIYENFSAKWNRKILIFKRI